MEIPFRNTIRNTPGKINVSELSAGLFFPIPEEIGSSRARQPVSLTRNVIKLPRIASGVNCLLSSIHTTSSNMRGSAKTVEHFFWRQGFSLNLFFLIPLKIKRGQWWHSTPSSRLRSGSWLIWSLAIQFICGATRSISDDLFLVSEPSKS